MKNNISFLIPLSLLLLLVYSCNSEKTKIANIDASVCLHANCADATIMQVTDQYYPPDHKYVMNDSRKYAVAWAEFLAFRYDIPLHVFEQEIKGDAFEQFLETGRGGTSVYYPSCFKEYSDRRLTSIVDELESGYGRSISTLSYGCGKTEYASSLPSFVLGGRTSGFGPASNKTDAITWYGDGLGSGFPSIEVVTATQMLTRPAGGRYYTDIQRGNMLPKDAASFVASQVAKTINSKGMYTNFMHWQDYYKNRNDSLIEGVKVMKPLFSALNAGIKVGKRNSKLDYNEAIEYLYAREAIDSVLVNTFSDSSLEVHIWQTKKMERDYSRIDTPISISVNKETILKDNTGVSISDKVISAFVDNKNVILNLKVDFDKEYQIIPVEITNQNTLYSLQSKLTLNALDETKIRASSPSKFVLFRRKSIAKEYEVEVVDRVTTFSESYSLPNLEQGYDYFCGALDTKRESTLLAL